MMTEALPEDIGGIPHGAHFTDDKFGKISKIFYQAYLAKKISIMKYTSTYNTDVMEFYYHN